MVRGGLEVRGEARCVRMLTARAHLDLRLQASTARRGRRRRRARRLRRRRPVRLLRRRLGLLRRGGLRPNRLLGLGRGLLLRASCAFAAAAACFSASAAAFFCAAACSFAAFSAARPPSSPRRRLRPAALFALRRLRRHLLARRCGVRWPADPLLGRRRRARGTPSYRRRPAPSPPSRPPPRPSSPSPPAPSRRRRARVLAAAAAIPALAALRGRRRRARPIRRCARSAEGRARAGAAPRRACALRRPPRDSPSRASAAALEVRLLGVRDGRSRRRGSPAAGAATRAAPRRRRDASLAGARKHARRAARASEWHLARGRGAGRTRPRAVDALSEDRDRDASRGRVHEGRLLLYYRRFYEKFEPARLAPSPTGSTRGAASSAARRTWCASELRVLVAPRAARRRSSPSSSAPPPPSAPACAAAAASSSSRLGVGVLRQVVLPSPSTKQLWRSTESNSAIVRTSSDESLRGIGAPRLEDDFALGRRFEARGVLALASCRVLARRRSEAPLRLVQGARTSAPQSGTSGPSSARCSRRRIAPSRRP